MPSQALAEGENHLLVAVCSFLTQVSELGFAARQTGMLAPHGGDRGMEAQQGTRGGIGRADHTWFMQG